MKVGEHYITKCRGCGAVVEQCKCMGPKEERWVPSCRNCVEPEIPPPSLMAVYSYERTAAGMSTPAETAKVLEQALAPHFAGAYFRVTAERGVAVEAARMSQEAFAKEQISKGYMVTGINPRAVVILVPDAGNAWTTLTVKLANPTEADVLQEVGIQPIRRTSRLTPEKAVKIVTDWFTKNADKLKSGAVRTAYDRTADQGPASRLKNVEPALKTAEREIERAKGILHGLVREMEMVAKHTHDATIKRNFDAVRDFSTRLDDIDKDIDGFTMDLEKFLRSYR